jgi:hypothetical protein
MRYFNISFGYRGPKSNFGTPDSDRALDSAIKELKKLLKDANIDSIHEYAWPDGSLYRILRFDDNIDSDEANNLVAKALEGSNLYLIYSDNREELNPEVYNRYPFKEE